MTGRTGIAQDELRGRWLLLVAMIVVGLNLRGPIVAVAPVLDEIQDELGIGETAAGLLTTVPVLCFAVLSPFMAGLARRFGTNLTVGVGVAILAVAVAVRPWGGYGLMLAATVLVGAAIAGHNVLLPAIARRDFAGRAGPVMSAVTTSLLISATLPALFTVPIAAVIGWRAALAVWAVLAVAALAIWPAATAHDTRRLRRERPRPAARTPGLDATLAQLPAAGGGTGPGGDPVPGGEAGAGRESAVDRNPGVGGRARSAWTAWAAWELGIYFGLQSLLFYAATAWLPTMLQERGGLDATSAGTALSLFQLLGIVGAIATPMLIRGRYLRYLVAVAMSVMWLAMFVGLLLAPAGWPVWASLGGVAQGAGIAMALSLIAMRATGGDAARSLSAMVQTVGYYLGALGPVLLGGLAAATAGWLVPFWVMIVLAVVLGVTAVRSAVPTHIH